MSNKQILAILFALLPSLIFAQFQDDFLDGNLDENPAWQGTLEKFKIRSINATTSQLQLNDTSATTGTNRAYISTPSQAVEEATWELSLQINTTLTSGNYVRFYLASDEADLTSALNGYFVWVGNTAKDICLYRQNGSTSTKIIDGIDNRAAGNNSIEIRITHDKSNNWNLYSRIGSETDYTLEGTCTEAVRIPCNYSGLLFNYSKTNAANYACNSILATGLPYTPPVAKYKKNDIVFSEILADPDPQVALPNYEFLEIYNRTDSAISLTNWQLIVNNKIATISQGQIAAHDYATICAEAAKEQFAEFGQAITTSSWPTLTNAGALIQLVDEVGNCIAWVDFSDSWYGTAGMKKDGGWSLERINSDYLDNHYENWAPSANKLGGTPGQSNSVKSDLQDVRAPQVSAVAATADTLIIHFSKPMDESTLTTSNIISEIGYDSILIQQPQANVIYLPLSHPLEFGLNYELTLNKLQCVDGLVLDEQVLQIAVPQTPQPTDLVINEILFNPKDDGVDFVELYNRADQVLDLSQVFITRRIDGEYEARTAICKEPILIEPQSYWVLTSSPDKVREQYDCPTDAHFVTVKLPNLNDDEGNIALILADGTTLDEFSYTAKMHHAFVVDAEGVSLERVNPAVATQQASNWQSASFEVGYATPGYKNSQYLESATSTKQNFWLEHDSFTPDNDGNDDLLQLNYNLPQDGFTASATIYTPTGVRVCRWLNGELLGTEGVLYWDGRDDNNTLCNVGIYVLVVEAIRPDGAKIQQKIVCVISAI